MTKNDALYEVLWFGNNEEKELLVNEKQHEAYQIEHARHKMLYALIKSIKELKLLLPKMYTYSIDESGTMKCDAELFVRDDYTRELVKEFANKFLGEKENGKF